jgi:hypothetical protein
MGNWSQSGKLLPAPLVDFYEISGAVAISGDTAVLCSAIDRIIYIFQKPKEGWSNSYPATTLTLPSTSGFLISVAIEGDILVVGASDVYYGPGTAYVYVKPAGGWTDMPPTATLSSTDSMPDDGFGGSVSISGNTIVIGASGADSYAGAGYVYVEPAGGWTDMTQTAKLTASDGQPNDGLGWAVSISGNTIAAGARGVGVVPGKAYVFVKPAGVWADMTQTAELFVADTQEDFNMGISISVSGDTVLAGANDFYDGYLPGGAYLYVKPPDGWVNGTQTAKLVAADRAGGDGFGTAVMIKGKTAIVGADGRSPRGNIEMGSAYVFSEPTGGWVNMSSKTVLTGSDARHFNRFGAGLDYDGSALIVGASGIGQGGAAYVFGLP